MVTSCQLESRYFLVTMSRRYVRSIDTALHRCHRFMKAKSFSRSMLNVLETVVHPKVQSAASVRSLMICHGQVIARLTLTALLVIA
jgi:hypothetical protein